MTKERLRRYIWLKQECKQLQTQLEVIMCEVASVSSPRLNGMPHGTDKHGLDDAIVRYEELAASFAKRLEQYQAETMAIENAIEEVEDPRLRLILRYRYQENKSWYEIADIFGYNRRWVLELHGQALRAIRDK